MDLSHIPGTSHGQYKPLNLVQTTLVQKFFFDTLHENKNFLLTKICEKDRKDHIFISFCMFPFHGNIVFSDFSSNENVRKQHLSVNEYSCVNMKFFYTIAVRKDEIL